MNSTHVTANGGYWYAGKFQVSLRGPGGPAVVTEIEKPFARVGGDRACEVVLPGRHAPPRSVYLHTTTEGVYCLNLEPRRPGRLAYNGWISSSVNARAGDFVLNASLTSPNGGGAEHMHDLRANGSAGTRAPSLHIESTHGERRAEYRLRRRLTLIGRLPPSKLRLDDAQVADAHCVLYWDGGRLWVVDLLSETGTFLNDRRIECATIEPGDELRIGGYRLWRRFATNGGPPEVSSNGDQAAVENADSIADDVGPSPEVLGAPATALDTGSVVVRLEAEVDRWRLAEEAARGEVDAAASHLASLRQSHDELESRCRELASDQRDWQAEKMRLENTVQAALARLREVEYESTLLSRRLDEAVAARDDAEQARLEAMDDRDNLARARDEALASRDDAARARDEAVALRDDAVRARDEAGAALEAAVRERDGLCEELAATRLAGESVARELESNRVLVEALRRDVDSLARRLEERQQQLDELGERQLAAAQREIELAQRLAAAVSEIDSVRAAAREDAMRGEEDLEEVRRQTEELHDLLATADAELIALKETAASDLARAAQAAAAELAAAEAEARAEARAEAERYEALLAQRRRVELSQEDRIAALMHQIAALEVRAMHTACSAGQGAEDPPPALPAEPPSVEPADVLPAAPQEFAAADPPAATASERVAEDAALAGLDDDTPFDALLDLYAGARRQQVRRRLKRLAWVAVAAAGAAAAVWLGMRFLR